MKFTKLEDEIISVLGQDGALQEKGGLLAREVFALCQLAGDKEEVCKALNAMVKRGEIVRDKDKLYSFADKKESDVVVESSETKKEEQVLTIQNHPQSDEVIAKIRGAMNDADVVMFGSETFPSHEWVALNFIIESLQVATEAIGQIKLKMNDPQVKEAIEAFRKAGNDPSN